MSRDNSYDEMRADAHEAREEFTERSERQQRIRRLKAAVHRLAGYVLRLLDERERLKDV